jgi:hypothetical protein
VKGELEMAQNILIAAITKYPPGIPHTLSNDKHIEYDSSGNIRIDCTQLYYDALKNAGYYVPDAVFNTRYIFNANGLTADGRAMFDYTAWSDVQSNRSLLSPGDAILFANMDGTPKHIGVFYGYSSTGVPLFYGAQSTGGTGIAQIDQYYWGNNRDTKIIGAIRPKENLYNEALDTTIFTPVSVGTSSTIAPPVGVSSPNMGSTTILEWVADGIKNICRDNGVICQVVEALGITSVLGVPLTDGTRVNSKAMPTGEVVNTYFDTSGDAIRIARYIAGTTQAGQATTIGASVVAATQTTTTESIALAVSPLRDLVGNECSAISNAAEIRQLVGAQGIGEIWGGTKAIDFGNSVFSDFYNNSLTGYQSAVNSGAQVAPSVSLESFAITDPLVSGSPYSFTGDLSIGLLSGWGLADTTSAFSFGVDVAGAFGQGDCITHPTNFVLQAQAVGLCGPAECGPATAP